MPGKLLRDIVNLLLYGGAFIGLCAAAITSLTFELIGSVDLHLSYVLLIGTSTAALYSAHRVIGLHKLEHVTTHDRYAVIRKYKYHIWMYCVGWVLITVYLFLPVMDFEYILWLLPGGSIALAYVIPFLSQGRRLRDFGWLKIIMIGWSWAWLTAFLPAYYFNHLPLFIAVIIGIERMLFIIAITIPFEIRDIRIDQSVGLITLPSHIGSKKTFRLGVLLCIIFSFLSLFLAIQFNDIPYFIACIVAAAITVWILKMSTSIKDDYFFSGLTDGLMVIILLVYTFIHRVA